MSWQASSHQRAEAPDVLEFPLLTADLWSALSAEEAVQIGCYCSASFHRLWLETSSQIAAWKALSNFSSRPCCSGGDPFSLNLCLWSEMDSALSFLELL